jgi:hypothetical protein
MPTGVPSLPGSSRRSIATSRETHVDSHIARFRKVATMRKADLTPEQLTCVAYSGRDTLLIKGPPGSGKTWALLLRGHMLAKTPKDTAQFITLTNTLARAAEDMRRDAAGDDGTGAGHGMATSTFHSWCTRLLRRNGVTFEIMSNKGQRGLLDRALVEARPRSPRAHDGLRGHALPLPAAARPRHLRDRRHQGDGHRRSVHTHSPRLIPACKSRL